MGDGRLPSTSRLILPGFRGRGWLRVGGYFAFISPTTANLGALSEEWAGGTELGTRNPGLCMQDCGLGGAGEGSLWMPEHWTRRGCACGRFPGPLGCSRKETQLKAGSRHGSAPTHCVLLPKFPSKSQARVPLPGSSDILNRFPRCTLLPLSLLLRILWPPSPARISPAS